MLFSVWLLWRSRSQHLARVVAEHADAEAAAGLSLLVCGAVLLVAAFAAPTLSGDWFPARQLVAAFPVAVGLVAWGLRHAPRTGAVLAALTLLLLGCGWWSRSRSAARRRLGAPGRGRALRAAAAAPAALLKPANGGWVGVEFGAAARMRTAA